MNEVSLAVSGDGRVIARFRRVSGDARARLRESVGRGVLRLQAHVVRNKLSGQVLKRRTGNLARSISYQVRESASEVIGVVGTNVKYAPPHEYGFKGTVQVRAHLRLAREAFGRQLRMPVWENVRAHPMRVDLPERSFLRSSLRELSPSLIADARSAVLGVLP